MSERDTYPSGVPFWVDIAHPDPDAAMRFYGELFGWEYSDPEAIPGGGRYYAARLRGRDVAGISSQPGGRDGSPPAWKTYVAVDSADATTAKAKQAGGSAVAEPFDAPPGRIALLNDPEGALFCIWEPKARAGAQLVNEPGAWSMSSLNTRDPDRAKAFYGAVFGWETETFELGGAEIWMWRLDGYVGGQPQQPVPRDVVAAMAPLGDDAPAEVRPHWSVDFWVDRVDGAVETVGRLGGAVIAPPYDVPSTELRQAVVADPHGATFSITEVTARS
jgi:uncharacterized protein